MYEDESYSFRSLITAVPADLSSERTQLLKINIQRFPEEAVYIYSFAERKMIYADSWEEVLGYKDDEINLPLILSATTPEFAPFADDLNQKALRFIQSKTEELEKYSFTIEVKKIHKSGEAIPLIVRVGVFRVVQNMVVEIIGRNQINRNLRFGKVMRYAAYGPEKSAFEEELNKQLFRHYAISQKEKEALALVASGYSFKEIAGQLQVSPSAIEKRILPLYKRFHVKSLSHLISFAHENGILNP